MTTLLAYDGRRSSERALDYAIEHSIRYEDPLYILTVVREEQMDPEDVDQNVQGYMQAAQRKAASAGATVHTIIETGKPDEMVLDVADRYDCDTIVVGKSNRTSLDRLLMGSVSSYVVKNATCTVIVVSDVDRQRARMGFPRARERRGPACCHVPAVTRVTVTSHATAVPSYSSSYMTPCMYTPVRPSPSK